MTKTSIFEPTLSPAPVIILSKGIDIIYKNDPIDWDWITNEDIGFVFVRATQGEKFFDRMFNTIWADAKSIGLLRSAYRIFDPDQNPSKQAEHFIQAFEGASYDGELPPVLRIETTGNQSSEDFLLKLQSVLTEIEAKTGHQPIIYTEYNSLKTDFLDQSGNYPEWILKYTLWITKIPIPKKDNVELKQHLLPNEWQENWLFWQYTNSDTLFYGSPAAFNESWSIVPY